MELNDISGSILDCALKVHSALGPGLLESVYEACLNYELRKRGVSVERQRPFPVIYDSVTIDLGFRIDLLVEDSVIVEVKAVERFAPIHEAQLLSYLKLTGLRLGLLLNFNVHHMKDGVRRMVNNL